MNNPALYFASAEESREARSLHSKKRVDRLLENGWIQRLNKLAESCGIKLKPIRVNTFDEVLITVENPEEPHAETCGQFGEQFCEALKGVHWRTGMKNYGSSNTKLYPQNGWAYVDRRDLVVVLDRLGTQS